MVAVPEVVGVHWKTFSGAVPELPHVPASLLAPLPQVSIVAGPETAGVHWKACSGEEPELPQVPARLLVPLVVPVNVPPAAGMTVARLHAEPGRVVVVVVVVGRVVVVLVVVV